MMSSSSQRAIAGLEFYRDLDASLPSNPDGEVVNFQNAGHSLLTVFTIVTLEGWSEIMDWVNVARLVSPTLPSVPACPRLPLTLTADLSPSRSLLCDHPHHSPPHAHTTKCTHTLPHARTLIHLAPPVFRPHWPNWLYFVALVVCGAFIATNLTLGVLSGHFTAVVSFQFGQNECPD